MVVGLKAKYLAHVPVMLALFLQPLTALCGISDGATIFMKYCAGCHGFDGRAVYEHAPSFSMGDRLEKDDRELLQSVLNGMNNMPPWRDKLPVKDLRNAIAYLRLMHERHEKGESPRQDKLPETYYLFKPVGEQDMDWVREQVNR